MMPDTSREPLAARLHGLMRFWRPLRRWVAARPVVVIRRQSTRP
jgi:hypothetical protein